MADLEELERLARACCATYVAGDRLAIYKSATASEDFKAALPQHQVPRLLLALLEERKRLLEALGRAERKLTAYVGVCKGDKELTDTVLPLARAAIAAGEIKPHD